ncbi:hypothetical protein Brsp07_04537 [Brucella sp. NBRC 14130]|uniref:hypothetical protein n=1 Tax=Brucella sp. NBRC 14130 TaxID=3075483 RepID=UPI003099871E
MLMTPTASLHGTSAEELIQQRISACVALDAAITALTAMAPNMRDYAGNPDGFSRDAAIHKGRVASLKELHESLMNEAVAIQEQQA